MSGRMGMRSLPVLPVVLVAATVFLTACSSSGGSTMSASALPTPGTQTATVANLRLTGPGPVANVGYPTPFAAIRGGQLLPAFMFDQLVWPDSTGAERPWLAKSWTTSADGKTWTFTLPSNAVWQDGTPLTAADVVFSFKYVMPGGPAHAVRPASNAIADVSSPRADTVVLQLNRVDPTLLDEIGSFSGVFIIPQHIWSAVSDPAHFQGPPSLIGSGPYKLTSFDLAQGNYQFTANNSFYLGKPVVQKVSLVSIPASADPLLALQRNQVDAATAPTMGGATPQSEITALRQQFTMLTARGEVATSLFFNLDAGFPYNSQTFRQAVAYAINRNDIVKREAGGRGVPGSAGGVGPGNPWLDPNLPEYTYDPGKAKALLDSIGVRDTDGDGTRNLPGGADVRLPLLTPSSSLDFAQFVKTDLAAVGLQVDITSVDPASSDAADTAGRYSMALVTYGGLNFDPSKRICGTYASTGAVTATGTFTSNKAHGYANPDVNALCVQLGTTLDHGTRQKLADQLQSIIDADVPILPLYVPDQVSFVNTKVFRAFAYTPGCPPCGVAENKLMLTTGRTTA